MREVHMDSDQFTACAAQVVSAAVEMDMTVAEVLPCLRQIGGIGRLLDLVLILIAEGEIDPNRFGEIVAGVTAVERAAYSEEDPIAITVEFAELDTTAATLYFRRPYPLDLPGDYQKNARTMWARRTRNAREILRAMARKVSR